MWRGVVGVVMWRGVVGVVMWRGVVSVVILWCGGCGDVVVMLW